MSFRDKLKAKRDPVVTKRPAVVTGGRDQSPKPVTKRAKKPRREQVVVTSSGTAELESAFVKKHARLVARVEDLERKCSFLAAQLTNVGVDGDGKADVDDLLLDAMQFAARVTTQAYRSHWKKNMSTHTYNLVARLFQYLDSHGKDLSKTREKYAVVEEMLRG